MPAPISEPRTISLDEAYPLFGVGRSTIYEEAKRGTVAGIPVIRIGRRLLLPRARVMAVLDGGQTSPRPEAA